MIRLNSERYRPPAAVDLDTKRLLHVRLQPAGSDIIPSIFLAAPRETNHVDSTVSLVDGDSVVAGSLPSSSEPTPTGYVSKSEPRQICISSSKTRNNPVFQNV